MSAAPKKNMSACPPRECAPCPCCESTQAIATQLFHVAMESWRVSCPNCRMSGPCWEQRALAVDGWNRLSALRDACERIRLAPELLARLGLGPDSLELLRRGVPLAGLPLIPPSLADYRRALSSLDHCAHVAAVALDMVTTLPALESDPS